MKAKEKYSKMRLLERVNKSKVSFDSPPPKTQGPWCLEKRLETGSSIKQGCIDGFTSQGSRIGGSTKTLPEFSTRKWMAWNIYDRFLFGWPRPIFQGFSKLVSGSVFCHFWTLFLGTVVHWINLGDCKLGTLFSLIFGHTHEMLWVLLSSADAGLINTWLFDGLSHQVTPE